MARVIFALFAFLALTWAEPLRFDGYQLFSVLTKGYEDTRFLYDLSENYPDLDFWRYPRTNQNATILVPPGLLEIFKAGLEPRGISYQVVSTDVQKIVDAGAPLAPEEEANRKRQAGTFIDHASYHTYNRIIEAINQIKTAYPDNVQLSNLNYVTHEGRVVTLVKLSGSTSATKKPAIVVESGIHAREWITPAVNLWVIEKVLADYKAGNAEARAMLDKYDWYFVPVANPDGYDYTHSTNRMWRKNRRYISTRCSGVDLNRNFDVVWGTTGISRTCTSDIYCGEAPFSEPETANMRDLFNSLIDTAVAYLSVHSFSQFLLVPWGYTEYVSRPANAVELDRVTTRMLQSLISTHGTQYFHGTAWELLNYAASGAAEDWALSRKPGIYAMCYELRPRYDDPRAFILPPSEIIGTAQEYYASLKIMAAEMRV
ncbi:Multifunctional pyrimidine synthesis protein CAD, partial [Biomphalaria glabrata]|uniref:Carboxypeptidase B-like n=1 Tax=Biomphalaria glabrata TaxID=6526 RepID=A0A9W2YWB1_BIOGL|nr:carboxypeptidase B-like [Biomphalaria glabrata]